MEEYKRVSYHAKDDRDVNDMTRHAKNISAGLLWNELSGDDEKNNSC